MPTTFQHSPLIFSSSLKGNATNLVLQMKRVRLSKVLEQGPSKKVLNRPLVQTQVLRAPKIVLFLLYCIDPYSVLHQECVAL
jgi:hypothetical protein